MAAVAPVETRTNRTMAPRAPTVVVSLQGRFHGFDLARELHVQGLLLRLMSSQPASVVARWGVPADRVRAVVRYDAINRVAARLGVADRIPGLARFVYEGFDRAAARLLEPADVVVAWSGMAFHTLRRARSLGARTVVERGSVHIAHQRELLDEEYRRFGLAPARLFDERMFERELREYEEADAIAVPSEFARQSFLERGVPARKLITVPYGVDLTSFAPGPRTRPGFRAIYAGAISLRKGIPDVLDAARLANVELWLLGSRTPEVEPFLRRAGDRVQHLGAVPQARLPEYYREADVFVMGSIEDGFGMVIPQALACGLPVVCTTNTGGHTLVQDGANGFVVPIRSPHLLAERIAMLRDDPVRLAAMKRAAVASVAGCSWSDYGRAVAAAYRRLAAGAESHP